MSLWRTLATAGIARLSREALSHHGQRIRAWCAIPLAIGVAAACRPQSKSVELLTSPIQLSTSATTITPNEPLPADYEAERLCIVTPPGYREDFLAIALRDSTGTLLTLQAEVVLDDDRVVPLGLTALLNTGTRFYCLAPGKPDSNSPYATNLTEPVRSVRIWSSKPMIVSRIVWTTRDTQ